MRTKIRESRCRRGFVVVVEVAQLAPHSAPITHWACVAALSSNPSLPFRGSSRVRGHPTPFRTRRRSRAREKPLATQTRSRTRARGAHPPIPAPRAASPTLFLSAARTRSPRPRGPSRTPPASPTAPLLDACDPGALLFRAMEGAGGPDRAVGDRSRFLYPPAPDGFLSGLLTPHAVLVVHRSAAVARWESEVVAAWRAASPAPSGDTHPLIPVYRDLQIKDNARASMFVWDVAARRRVCISTCPGAWSQCGRGNRRPRGRIPADRRRRALETQGALQLSVRM